MKIAKYQVSFCVFVKLDILALGLLGKQSDSIVCIRDLFYSGFFPLHSAAYSVTTELKIAMPTGISDG